ncbi:hypothetical protein HK104_009067 [Borealophlyctis nickersoniae]|nr:hypothetical protein HK104_009067 [Borealophlyctis nickersoniae]
MLKELHDVFDALNDPNSMFEPRNPIRVVVITGAGKAFCAGLDIRAAFAGTGGKQWDYRDMRSQQLLSRLILKMRLVPQPIIAAVNGAAAGGGFSIALAADVRLATQGTKMNAAFIKLGLTATDMGSSYFLPRLVGHSIASELLLTGRDIAADRALATGLVSEVYPDATFLHDAARTLAREMVQASPKGLALTKEQLNSVADGMSLQAVLGSENGRQMYLTNEPESSEYAQKWVSKLGGKGKKAGAKL